MEALTEPEIRDSFANVTKGEAGRIPMPRDFAEVPWEDLDFLGWRDLGAQDRAYLVARRIDGEPKGIMFRLTVSNKGFLRRSMCSLCYTSHAGDGVALMTARKAGQAGRQGNSAGLYICTDLACSLYIRGKKLSTPGGRFDESISVDEQVWRMTVKLDDFLRKLDV